MAEAWVNGAQNDARVMDNLCAEASKYLTTAESRNKELALKLSAADRDQRSIEAGLKTIKAQAKEQRQKLHYIEIELATYKQ